MNKLMLIVDDNEVNRGLLSAIFEDEFTIKTASDGRTALATLGYYGAETAIVLLDLVMPEMDGFKVLQSMQERAEWRSIPVIVVSGEDERETALKAIKCGAVDYITKPVDPEMLRAKVEAAIGKAENARLRAENDYFLLQSSKEAKYRTVLESTGTVVVEYDRFNGTYQYDPSISKHIAGNFDGRKLWQLLMSDMVGDVWDVKAMQDMVYQVANHPQRSGNSMTVRLKTPAGARQWFRMQVFIHPGQGGASKMLLTFNNINDEVESAEKLRYQAERDPLTGLYNRTMFFEKAAEMIASHAPGHYVMGCFDIDGFKVINDQYGTEKGDDVLKQIAAIFSAGFQPAGSLIGRISADNFAALHPLDFINSGGLAALIRKALVLDGSIPPITLSIGRYVVDDLSLSISAMYDRAALAKATVKDRFDRKIAWYDESMREQVIHDQEIVNEMKPALEQGQFVVWLQPQYNHATGALIGAEALVRWRHPLKGIVSPGEFIPVFERNGFVYELDKYVWEQTCVLLRKWMDDGYEPLPVSVNISRHDLFQEDLVEVMTGLVDKYDIPIDMLRLEITESAFAESTEQVVSVVKRLIGHGFMVEIDDFGSGYSSLNTLKDVPAHILKLDMRFLENSEDSDRGGNVLESVVRMAKWLGMSVIAEGVETLEQADYLKSIGCVYMQGYLFAKPMPSDEYETFFQSADKEEKLLALQTVSNLDNNAFWDARSMDTLIFNSFVGAACIMEYSEGHVELLRVSEMFMQMLKSDSLSVEDALKLDWERHIAEESRLTLIAAAQRSIRTGRSITGEYLFVDIPGCTPRLFLRVTMRVIASTGGSHLVYCLGENITAQKEAEQKERAAAEQLQAIMSNITGGVNAAIIEDGVPRVQFANEQYYKMRGYTKEQYQAEVPHLARIIHPEDRERMFHAMSTATEPFSIVYRIICRDGEVRWVLNNITFVRLPGYDVPVQLSVTNDITEVREAEQKERAATDQLQAIMDNINSGVAAAVIRDGLPHILFANEQFYTIMGYTREQFQSEVADPSTVVCEPYRARVFCTISAADKPFTLIYKIRRRDGVERWIQNNITYVQLPGQDEPVQLSVTNDITEMREAERKEHDISTRLQAILDALNSGVSGVTLHGDTVKYVFANDMYYNMLGYTKEQFEAEVGNGLKLIHPDDRARIDTELAALLQNGGSTVLEYRVIRRDGETIHVRVNAAMLTLDGVDEPVSLGVTTDITDMMRAQQKIYELSERMQTILDNVDCGVTAAEVEHGEVAYLFGNDRFFTLHGYTREQYAVEVDNIFELVHPDDRQNLIETVDRVNRTGKNAVREYRITRRDGRERWLRVAISMRSLAQPVRPVLFSVYTDVTAARLARLKLRETNEKLKGLNDTMAKLNAQIANDRESLQTMMDDMPGGFMRLRVLNEGAVATEYVNDNFCHMRGLTREEILSDDAQDAMASIHPDDAAAVRQAVLEMVGTGETRSLKYRIRCADGSYIPLSAFGRVTTGEDGAEYINVYYADVSEQEKKELTIRETVPFILSAILAASPDLAFAKDKDFRYICGSAELVKLTRCEQESDVIGKTDYELFPQAVADEYRSDDMRLLETGRPILDKVDAVPTANGLRYFKLSKYVLRDTFGNVLGVYGLGRDITEERDAYARLKLLVDSIPGGIASYVSSPEGIKITYFNDGFCGMFGYTHEEYARTADTGVTSLVFAEDLPQLMEKVDALIREDKPLDSTHRVHTKSGGYKWVNLRGGVAERHGDVCLFNAVLYDVTEHVEAENILRLSEEQFRIAAAIGGRTVAQYDIKTGAYYHQSQFLLDKGFPSKVENVPQAFIDAGIIAPESIEAYLAFHEKLRQGDSPCSLDLAVAGDNGTWRWLREDATIMTDTNGAPVRAIIVFSDITELREKEAVFRKWQQSLRQRPEETYALFRCNLSKNSSFDFSEGRLFFITFQPGAHTFNDRTQEYVSQCVYEDDRAAYLAFLNADTLLAGYYRGVRTKSIEYRETLPDGSLRWLRLTVELVEYPGSTDVEAFLLFEDIDTAKREELRTKELAQTDPLTGVLNRTAFCEAVEQIIAESSLGGSFAILMLDIDAFKRINDTLGHAMGDQVLRDTTDALRGVLRHGDLLGRLGGDEFLVCLRDIHNDEGVKGKAAHICAMLRKPLSPDVRVSASIGVAVYPRDGKDFETLYRKADTALYHVKEHGKDNYAFYEEAADA